MSSKSTKTLVASVAESRVDRFTPGAKMKILILALLFHYVRAQQSKLGGIGIKCVKNSECKRPLICRPYSKSPSSAKRCEVLSKKGWNCDDSDDCEGSLSCKNFRCVKSNNKEEPGKPSQDAEVQIAGGIGEVCVSSAHCRKPLVCRPYTASAMSKKRCDSKARENWTCSSSSDCFENLVCNKYRCTRNLNNTIAIISQKPEVKISSGNGEQCASSTECKSPLVCRPFIAAANSKKRCEKKAREDWTCSSSSDCYEDLICKNFKCTRKSAPNLSMSFTRVYADYPLHVFEAGGTVLPSAGSNYLYVFGGFHGFPNITSKVYRRKFGISHANWEAVAELPHPAATHMAQAADGPLFCCVGGFVGGFPGLSGVLAFCFNSETNLYTSLPDLPAPRAGGGLAFMKAGSKISLVYSGGTLRDEYYTHTDYGNTWTLNLDDGDAKWVEHAAMPDPRNHIAAVETCGRILFVGGQYEIDEEEGNSRKVSEWLTTENKWSSEPPPELPLPLGHVSASVVAYKCGVFIVGGMTNNVQHSDTVLYWHPTTNQWSFVGNYPIKAATPVCGVVDDAMMCTTGGDYALQNHVYYASIDEK